MKKRVDGEECVHPNQDTSPIMNALRHLNRASIVNATQNRFASSHNVHTHKIQDLRRGKLKQDWLSDRSTYPLLVIISAGFAFALGVGVVCITTNPDVQIANAKKKSILRTWE